MRYEKPEYEGDSRPETQKHIDKVNEFGKQFADKLKSRLILHDASKLIEPECKFFDKGTPNLASSTYGEKSYDDAKDSIKEGIEHHYKMNDHHPRMDLPARPGVPAALPFFLGLIRCLLPAKGLL